MPSRLDWRKTVEDIRALIHRAHNHGVVNVQGSTAIRDDEEFGEAPRIWLVIGDALSGVHTFEISGNLIALLAHKDIGMTPEQVKNMKKDFPDMGVEMPEEVPSHVPDSIFFASRSRGSPYVGPFAIIALETHPRRPGTTHETAPQAIVAEDEGRGLEEARDLPPRADGIKK